ncbi:hypothetical protein ABZ876_17590 [Streptomyces sp. NPDC046931]|uniref:hypothetical protein n=1 Tax=Streptomyces sp. NPDC046931 TaxID=3154806 RepID=UPI00340E69CA
MTNPSPRRPSSGLPSAVPDCDQGSPPPAAAAATAAQLVPTGRRRILRLAHHWPWSGVITEALTRLEALPNPG